MKKRPNLRKRIGVTGNKIIIRPILKAVDPTPLSRALVELALLNSGKVGNKSAKGAKNAGL